MNAYKVTYTWTKAELLKPLRHHYQSKLRPSIVMLVNGMALLLATLSIFILFVEGLRSSVSISSLILITFAVYWLFLSRRVNEWFLTRGFDKTPAANAVVLWQFSEQQLAQECAGVVSFQAEWKLLSKVMEVSDGFLLYTYPKNMFYWLPFAGFEKPEGIEAFKSIVQSKQIKYVKRTG
jgi:YcxB-like protein